jgi:hypothetical protein
MTARTPIYLKGRFEQGDIPQGTDYEDVFDSYINIATSAEQTIDSNLRTTKKFIAANVSATSVTAATGRFSGIVSAASLYADSAIVSALNASIVSANSVVSNTASFVTVTASNINVSGNVIYGSFDVSALATTQAGALTLNGTTNFVIFADGNNTAVKLPTSVRGRQQFVVNAASTTIKIFPATSGRFLVTAVNASLNIPADRCATIFHKGDDRYGVQIG